MKYILLSAFIFCSFAANSQYSPSGVQNTPLNKPVGLSGKPDGARTYYYDPTFFTYRPFVSVAEANSWIIGNARKGHFFVVINTGGTLSFGAITGGTNSLYYWKDGIADVDLVALGGGVVNLSKSTTSTTNVITPSGGGISVTLNAADGTNAGLLSAEKARKLDSISRINNGTPSGTSDSLFVFVNDSTAKVKQIEMVPGTNFTSITKVVTSDKVQYTFNSAAGGVGSLAIGAGITGSNSGKTLFVGTGNILQQHPVIGIDSAAIRFGIGTLSPSAPLHIFNASSGGLFQVLVEAGSAGAEAGIEFKAGGNSTRIKHTGTAGSNILEFSNGGVGHTFVTSSGNWGLGVTPTAKLHVNGSVRLQGIGEAAGRVLTTDVNGNATWQVVSGGGVAEPSQQIIYGTGGSATSNNYYKFNSTTRTASINGMNANSSDPRLFFDDTATISGVGTRSTPIIKIGRFDKTGGYGNVAFYINSIVSKDFSGAIPNHIVNGGHNMSPGGGAVIAGKAAVGYSYESSFDQDGDGQNGWQEAHPVVWVDSTGFQYRPSSFIMNGALLDIDHYVTASRFYIKNPLGIKGTPVYGSYFSVTQDQMNLNGNNPLIKILDTSSSVNFTQLQQSGADANMQTRRHWNFSSTLAGINRFILTNYSIEPDQININSPTNYGSQSIINVNMTNASTTGLSLSRSGTPYLQTNTSDNLKIGVGSFQSGIKLDVIGKLAIRTVDSTAVPATGTYLYQDPVTGEIKRAIPAGGVGSGVTTMASFGSTPNANGGTITGVNLALQPANLTNPGGISLSAQTMGAGVKTFEDGTITHFKQSGTKLGQLSFGGASNYNRLVIDEEAGSGTIGSELVFFRSSATDRFKIKTNTSTGQVSEELGAGGYFKTISINGTEDWRLTASHQFGFRTTTMLEDFNFLGGFQINGAGGAQDDISIDGIDSIKVTNVLHTSIGSNLELKRSTTTRFATNISGVDRSWIETNPGTGEIQYGAGAGGYFQTFWANNAEQARLTSTGLGIGGTAAFKLDVFGDMNTSTKLITPAVHFVLNTALINMNGSSMQIATGNGVPKMIINSSGNTTIGNNITPNNRKLFVDGSIGANKDSISVKSTIAAQSILLQDTGTNKFERIPFANFKTELGIDEGDYTPTLTSVANVSGTPTASSWHFRKDGNTIVAFGEITIDPTTTLTLTRLAISFPAAWASAVAAIDVSGYGVVKTLNETMAISGDSGNARAILEFTPVDVAARTIKCQMVFKYIAP